MTTQMTLKAPEVILVNDNDHEVGTCEKLLAHQTGELHRAVSVFLTTEAGDKVLLQRRSSAKYHSPGKWSNAACTHPLKGESPLETAKRALKKELGISAPLLKSLGFFIYKVKLEDDLFEHELDHVFIGSIDESTTFQPPSDEVEDVKWLSYDELREEVKRSPEVYTKWLPYLLQYIGSPRSGMDFRGL